MKLLTARNSIRETRQDIAAAVLVGVMFASFLFYGWSA